MARLVAAPNAGSLFGKGLFGNLSQNTLQWMQGNIAAVQGLGTEYSQKVYERSLALFNAINSDAAVLAAEAVLSQVESMTGQDIIEALTSVSQLQAAQSQMQNYIMAHPVIRQAWYDGKVEGYSDTYVDPEPGRIGHEQQVFRQVMNGVLVPHEEASYQYSLYYDRASSIDGVLSLRDVAAILDSQEAAVHALEAGEQDPVSQYGASL